jgi:hypothetical protein
MAQIGQERQGLGAAAVPDRCKFDLRFRVRLSRNLAARWGAVGDL